MARSLLEEDPLGLSSARNTHECEFSFIALVKISLVVLSQPAGCWRGSYYRAHYMEIDPQELANQAR